MSGQTTPMRVNVAGYAGSPVSIFCAYGADTDMLAVLRETDYEATERDDFLKITNQVRDVAFDAVFTEELIRDAITAFFQLDALRLLVLGSKVQRCDPRNKIERDGVDDGGTKYRIAPDITNAQVAVLAAAWYANTQRSVRLVQEFAEEMQILTI